MCKGERLTIEEKVSGTKEDARIPKISKEVDQKVGKKETREMFPRDCACQNLMLAV